MSAAVLADSNEDDVPVDIDPRSGRLMSLGELRRALQLVRDAGPDSPGGAALPAQPAAPNGHHQPGLPSVPVDASKAAGWVVGASGGSGETLLAHLLTACTGERFLATDHSWPAAEDRVPVVVCARTNMRSLSDAQHALAQWGTGRLHAVRLVGMVLVADAPGKEPRPIQEFAQVLAGGVPRQWRLPWIPQWRLGPPEPAAVPKPIQTILAAIRSAITNADDTAPSN